MILADAIIDESTLRLMREHDPLVQRYRSFSLCWIGVRLLNVTKLDLGLVHHPILRQPT